LLAINRARASATDGGGDDVRDQAELDALFGGVA
jgi:hypothetical protein